MNDHLDGLARLPRRTFTGAALATLAMPLASASATATATPTPTPTAVDATPAAPPSLPRLIAPGGPVRVEGMDELVGEIHLARPAGEPSPMAVRLLDADRGDTFAEFQDTALTTRLSRIDEDRLLIHVELRSRPDRPL